MKAGRHDSRKDGILLSGSLVLLLFCSPVLMLALGSGSASSVRRVLFLGNQTLRASEFTVLTRAGQPWSDSLLAEDKARILREYAEQGFFWAAVETEQRLAGNRTDAVFHITEGRRARIGTVSLSGNRMVSGPRLRILLPAGSGFFAESGINSNAKALLKFYTDNGFPFCQVRAESLELRNDSLSYVLEIDEGPEVRLSDVRFSGQYETRPGLLKRLLGLELGTPYSETRTQQRIRRLDADPLLQVEDLRIVPVENRFWLELKVKEDKANRVSGAAAYSADYRELVGMFDLNLANLFGTRRQVSLNWQGSPGRQDLSFSYTEPWLLALPVHATAKASNRTRDSSFSKTDIGAEARAEVAEPLALLVETDFEWVGSGIAALPSSRTLWLGSGLELETRDDRVNPSRGSSGSLLTRFGSRRITGSGSALLVQGLLDFEQTLTVLKWFGPYLAGHGRLLLTSDSIYDYDEFELGGAQSLRGYREGELQSARCFWLNAEFRYRPSPAWRVYPFLDWALVQTSMGTRFGIVSPSVYAGCGAGMRIASRLGLVGIDYGIPLRAGASPLRGKIHFSLQTSF